MSDSRFRICIMSNSRLKTLDGKFLPSRVAVCSNIWFPIAAVRFINENNPAYLFICIAIFVVLMMTTYFISKRNIGNSYNTYSVVIMGGFVLCLEIAAAILTWSIPSIMVLIGFALFIPLFTVSCLKCVKKRQEAP